MGKNKNPPSSQKSGATRKSVGGNPLTAVLRLILLLTLINRPSLPHPPRTSSPHRVYRHELTTKTIARARSPKRKAHPSKRLGRPDISNPPLKPSPDLFFQVVEADEGITPAQLPKYFDNFYHPEADDDTTLVQPPQDADYIDNSEAGGPAYERHPSPNQTLG